MQIHESSQVIPLPGVPTLFLDVKTTEDVTDSNEPRPPQDFRGFRLHRVVYVGASPPVGQVAFPHLEGKNRVNRRPSSHGESSIPTHELPFPAWPQPPSTPTLGWQEVDEKVTEVMDQLHNLYLETVQEMGFIWAVDQALAKSLMVEFLRLKLITGDDLSTTLQTWHADMEATTEEFLRDLDSATQTSTTLPSKNAAVEAALHKYREVAKLKLALLLTQLDTAQEEMEKFIQFRLEELQSQQETRHLVMEFPQGLQTIEAGYTRCCAVNL